MTAPTSFWQRRRAAVAAEAKAEDQAREQAVVSAQEQALAEKPDEVLLAEAGLPEPEALETPEQLRAFLKAQLPQRLKTRALRHHWGTNPVLANLDGLLEYGEDYTDAARCVPNMKTVYQVGKGMFDKFAEAVPVAPPQPQEDGAGEAELPMSVAEPDAAPADRPDARIAAADDAPRAADPQTMDTPPIAEIAPAPRRMRFRFET